MICVPNCFSQQYNLSISASHIAEGDLIWETCTKLCAHLKTVQFFFFLPEQREDLIEFKEK